jgi:hypothetical protein
VSRWTQNKHDELFYPTLLESFAFTIVLSCFKIAEDAVVGMSYGKSFHETVTRGA